MHRKSIVRSVLVAFFVIAGITALVLAASGDTQTTTTSPAVPQDGTVETAAVTSAPQEPVIPDSSLSLNNSFDASASVQFVHYDTVIPFKTQYIEDDTLAKGTEIVEVEGSDGLERYTEELLLHDGQEVSRQSVGTTIVREATDRVVRVGTYVEPEPEPEPEPVYTAPAATQSGTYQSGYYSGTGNNLLASVQIDPNTQTITTPSGTIYSYSQTLACEATAYSCEGYSWNTTATGTTARVGAIAVDPNFIPLGSRLFVVTNDGQFIYGYCTAEDTGGAIKNNIIDLYFDTFAECYQFGRRDCTVYVLS